MAVSAHWPHVKINCIPDKGKHTACHVLTGIHVRHMNCTFVTRPVPTVSEWD